MPKHWRLIPALLIVTIQVMAIQAAGSFSSAEGINDDFLLGSVGVSGWDRRLSGWPEGVRVMHVGESQGYPTLAEALDSAADGDRIVVHGGRHPGPVRIYRRVWIEGHDEAEILGNGQGTVVTVEAPGARITGFRISRSGDSLDSEDSGIMIRNAPGALAAGCSLSKIQFGIVVKQSPDVQLLGNSVEGREGDLSLNGDGIRLWFSDGGIVAFNTVRRTREIIVEASERTEIRGNAVTGGKLGLHLMRSPSAVMTGNYLAGNSTGLYVMYGSGARLVGNRIENNRGPSGYGIGLKEADNIQVLDNWLLDNRTGIYLDNSPLSGDRPNSIVGNLIAYNDSGVSLTPSTSGNRFEANDFLENYQQVAVTGGGQLVRNAWTGQSRGNYWSDYIGYDADGDGIGDLIHAPAPVFERWTDRMPVLLWFRFTPAARAVDLAVRAFPLAEPPPILTDVRPLIAPADRRDSPWSAFMK